MGTLTFTATAPAPVPEPSTWALLMIGLMGVAATKVARRQG
ncbi:PEP-CTERM sorting domain-containing protein [Acinetobacter baumannii]